jgi:peptide/nickel transport system permease protein
MKQDSTNIPEKEDETLSLDDTQRIKVLSPTALIVKRFIRNKLAITGLIMIGAMLLFSFVGGALSPYDRNEAFTKYEDMSKLFAGVSENTEFKFIVQEGKEFDLIAQSQFVLAVNKARSSFSAGGKTYLNEKINDDFYVVNGSEEVALAMGVGNNRKITLKDESLGSSFTTIAERSVNSGAESFNYAGETFLVVQGKKIISIIRPYQLAVATMNVFHYNSPEIDNNFDFCYAIEMALNELNTGSKTEESLTLNGEEFNLVQKEDAIDIFFKENGQYQLYGNINSFLIQPLYDDVFLSLNFKDTIKAAIEENASQFTYPNEEGEEISYKLYRQNLQWTVERQETTLVINKYLSPSWRHWVGTDGNGMDLLTRLMYGGRISLLIGFIVVFIQTFIGIVLGGVAGYFGKWVDNLIMRIVDVFNCIPSLPLIIILGAMMDQLRVDPYLRMVYLMVILAILGWPSIARMVRGQILTLREQEYMIAAEATGISVRSRIFKHLIPNVMPQLIVISTLSLGGVILTESVLSFLGLGVKYPFASWGNIINAVSNVYVMTNYLFVWIPAGFCILITVLGFNFIGDGLRDAFDPKMKR